MSKRTRKKAVLLSRSEQIALARIRKNGCWLLTTAQKPSKALLKLVEKGYARELPGLFADTPQGFELAD